MVFEAAARGETLKPAISAPYIVRRADCRVGADCPSGAALGVARPASAWWAEARMEFAALSLLETGPVANFSRS